jgi:hypothetical protein
MKAYGGSKGIAPSFLISALDGVEFSASRRFTPEETAPGTHGIEGWVGPSVCLDSVEKGKFFHCRESNPSSPALSL